ncbi:cation:proton antiporter [Micromonospora olivasterospora]|uniref:Kef-type K+ transport system membrane component KefB n=1 Tax=Micromonospora olivasterospora TaxID=1880 RepID=A0A562IJV9_MICOL|nr:cation:proton antiporter [Micromonospora olivasterospora]TWH70904.1 Kef-type K+ transport system membrane component KefB [Micromonospora olivasterospora]
MDLVHSDLKVAIVVADIAIVLIVGSLLVTLFRRMKQPPVIGEITAGIVLGPSVLGLLPGDVTGFLFPTEIRPHLSMISQVGLLLFMFLVGWEFNAQLLKRKSGAIASVSLSAIGLSFALGIGAATLLHDRHDVVNGKEIPFWYFAVYLGIAMSITAFPVLARLLSETGLAATRIGTLTLASAALDDVMAWTLLAVIVVAFTASGGVATLVTVLGLFLLYVLAMVVVVRPLLRQLVGRLTRGGKASPYLVPLIASGVFLSAYVTSWIGVHAIFGAFAFGLVMPREPRTLLATTLHAPLESGTRLLLPIFFIVTGLSVDVGALGWTGLGELAIIMAAACLGKLLGAAAPAKLSGMSWRDSCSVGLLMNTRGLTELVILNIGVTLGVLDGQMFTMMVLMALFTTAMAMPLLPKGLPRVPGNLFTIPPGARPSDPAAAARVESAEQPVKAGKP